MLSLSCICCIRKKKLQKNWALYVNISRGGMYFVHSVHCFNVVHYNILWS